MTLPFWKTKTLAELSKPEWEALCDGCGKCCLLKLEYEDTGAVAYTKLACRMLDPQTCQCSDYANRRQHVPDCVKLTPKKLARLKWLPTTCAYRLVHEGKDLADWHHLVCGDPGRIHREGHSVQGRAVPEDTVIEADEEDWIFDWDGAAPKA
jgi:uncharacterized protein